jgi:hypothetical protein
MNFKFVAQQRVLGLSECERLCRRSSRDIQELALRSGWHGLPGSRIDVSVGTALNMLVLSIAMSHGVELHAMATSLPGLREEALLKLGTDVSNWSFDGSSEAQKQFWTILYGSQDAVRPRIASLLGCYDNSTTRLLRFFSPKDFERLTAFQFDQGCSPRTPRFAIDAHDLASQVRKTCGAPLFSAKAANLG